MSLHHRPGLLLGAFLLCGSLAQAQSADDSGRQHRGPPQAALDACANAGDGASCSFAFNGETKNGTCRVGPSGQAAACFPADWHPHGPPPEAVSACTNLAVGTTCNFTLGDRAVSGTCRAEHRDASVNVCASKDFEGHPHGPPPEAVQACASSQEGASCSFSLGQDSLTGTCRTGPRGESLACAPPRPER